MGNINEIMEKILDYGDYRAMCEAFTAASNNEHLSYEVRWQLAYNGRFPLCIKAVAEGTWVPVGNILMSIESTDPRFAWVPGWFETLLMMVWYPTTVATQSFYIRKLIRSAYERTGSDMAGVDYAVHDFAFRGSTSPESAAIGGSAHLLSFNGTDTTPAIMLAQDHYGTGMAGFSIPATEHSVIMAWGEEGEEAAYRHLLRKYPEGLIACVSDTYDLYRAVQNLWGWSLKDDVLAHQGAVVIRPDSGNPLIVVPWVLNALGYSFGETLTPKQYALLNGHVRVINGDGMNYDSIGALYDRVASHGFAAQNLAIGAGAGLLQKVDRDTQSMAVKLSSITRGGVEQAVYKHPVTSEHKRSKPGKMSLVRQDGKLTTISGADQPGNLLQTVYHNGNLLRRQKFEDIRAAVRAYAGED
jgi:nicotinamide phosphoribosyltransferase